VDRGTGRDEGRVLRRMLKAAGSCMEIWDKWMSEEERRGGAINLRSAVWSKVVRFRIQMLV
jgi:hypothetical protein